eukprot:ANDGO_06226.mRNA.1 Coatomer subunit epsilon
MADDLYDSRNLFFIGEYAQAVALATGVADSRLSDTLRTEKEYIIARSQIALGQADLVLAEAKFKSKNASIAFQALRVLASFSALPVSHPERSALVAQVEEWASGDLMLLGPFASVCCAVVFLALEKVDRALHVLHKVQSLEMSAMLVECFLAIQRVDLAEKGVQRMQQVDDEHVLTQLSLAKVRLANAPAANAVNDAVMIVAELGTKYGDSVGLMNLQAVASMHQNRFEDAEKLLLKALAKRSNDVETLVNMAVVAVHLNKSRDLVQRYVAQVKTIAPQHPWVRALAAKESLFDESAQSVM